VFTDGGGFRLAGDHPRVVAYRLLIFRLRSITGLSGKVTGKRVIRRSALAGPSPTRKRALWTICGDIGRCLAAGVPLKCLSQKRILSLTSRRSGSAPDLE
jgi:hypothetical protein